jgi:hypothetical protein
MSFRSLWRSFDSNVLLAAFFVGLFAALLLGIQQSLMQAELTLKPSLFVMVYLQSTLPDGAAQKWGESLKAADPEVLSFSWTSKEQAYQQALKDPLMAKPLMLLRDNPLPASYLVRLDDRAWWQRDDPTEKIKTLPSIQEIRWDPQAHAVFRSIHQWRLRLMRLTLLAGLALFSWTFFGLYQFFKRQTLPGRLWAHLALGLTGGAIASGLWNFGLSSLANAATSLRGSVQLALPLAAGILAAIACFGFSSGYAE